jgi:gamma-glutamylcyclotransferase (GGCT)/AIG2-like uncharacterized protein YtfP
MDRVRRELIAPSRRVRKPAAGRGQLLFVYGTLRPFVDIPMARWLRSVATYAGTARVRGRLYDLGPYPALRPAQCRDEWVAGELYFVGAKALRVLDRYEAGDGWSAPRFVRKRCKVEVARSRSSSAWVYLYQRVVNPRSRIPSGDYRPTLRSRSQFGDRPL